MKVVWISFLHLEEHRNKNIVNHEAWSQFTLASVPITIPKKKILIVLDGLSVEIS